MSGVAIDVKSNAPQATRGIDILNNSLQKLTSGLGRVNEKPIARLGPAFDKSAAAAGKTSAAVQHVTKSIRNLAIAAASFKGFQAFHKIADDLLNINTQLAFISENQHKVIQRQRELYKLSRETRGDFAEAANLLTNIKMTVEGIDDSRASRLVSTLSKLATISGSTTAGIQGAMIQLNQGISSGILRGQEYNSVAEQMKGVTIALARHLKMTIGEVRNLAMTEGIAVSVLMDALDSQSKWADEMFGRVILTADKAVAELSKSVRYLVGDLNIFFNYTTTFANRLLRVANALDENNLAIISKAALYRSVVKGWIANTKELFILLSGSRILPAEDLGGRLEGIRGAVQETSQHSRVLFGSLAALGSPVRKVFTYFLQGANDVYRGFNTLSRRFILYTRDMVIEGSEIAGQYVKSKAFEFVFPRAYFRKGFISGALLGDQLRLGIESVKWWVFDHRFIVYEAIKLALRMKTALTLAFAQLKGLKEGFGQALAWILPPWLQDSRLFGKTLADALLAGVSYAKKAVLWALDSKVSADLGVGLVEALLSATAMVANAATAFFNRLFTEIPPMRRSGFSKFFTDYFDGLVAPMRGKIAGYKDELYGMIGRLFGKAPETKVDLSPGFGASLRRITHTVFDTLGALPGTVKSLMSRATAPISEFSKKITKFFKPKTATVKLKPGFIKELNAIIDELEAVEPGIFDKAATWAKSVASAFDKEQGTKVTEWLDSVLQQLGRGSVSKYQKVLAEIARFGREVKRAFTAAFSGIEMPALTFGGFKSAFDSFLRRVSEFTFAVRSHFQNGLRNIEVADAINFDGLREGLTSLLRWFDAGFRKLMTAVGVTLGFTLIIVDALIADLANLIARAILAVSLVPLAIVDAFSVKMAESGKALPKWLDTTLRSLAVIPVLIGDIAASIVLLSANLISGALTTIFTFGLTVKEIFWNIYDDVVGHSSWPDLIDGIIRETSRLSIVTTQLRKFGELVKEGFAKIRVKSPLLDMIASLDYGHVMRRLSLDLASVATGAVLFAFGGGKLRLIVANTLFNALHYVFKEALPDRFKSMGSVVGAVAGNLGRYMSLAFKETLRNISDSLGPLLYGFFSEFFDGPIGSMVVKITSAITSIFASKPRAALAVGLAAYALTVKKGWEKVVSPLLFGVEATKNAKAERGLIQGILSTAHLQLPNASNSVFKGLIAEKQLFRAAGLMLATSLIDGISFGSAAMGAAPLLLQAIMGGPNFDRLVNIPIKAGIDLFKKLRTKIFGDSAPVLAPPKVDSKMWADSIKAHVASFIKYRDEYGAGKMSLKEVFTKGLGANDQSIGDVVKQTLEKNYGTSVAELQIRWVNFVAKARDLFTKTDLLAPFKRAGSAIVEWFDFKGAYSALQAFGKKFHSIMAVALKSAWLWRAVIAGGLLVGAVAAFAKEDDTSAYRGGPRMGMRERLQPQQQDGPLSAKDKKVLAYSGGAVLGVIVGGMVLKAIKDSARVVKAIGRAKVARGSIVEGLLEAGSARKVNGLRAIGKLLSGLGKGTWAAGKGVIGVLDALGGWQGRVAAFAAVGGVLAGVFFGRGNTFMERLGWSYDMLKEMIGLSSGQPTTAGGKAAKVRDAFSFETGLASVSRGESGEREKLLRDELSLLLGSLDYDKISKKELKIIEELGATNRNLQDEIRKNVAMRGYASVDDSARMLTALNDSVALLQRFATYDERNYAERIKAAEVELGNTPNPDRGWFETLYDNTVGSLLSFVRDRIYTWIRALGEWIGSWFGWTAAVGKVTQHLVSFGVVIAALYYALGGWQRKLLIWAAAFVASPGLRDFASETVPNAAETVYAWWKTTLPKLEFSFKGLFLAITAFVGGYAALVTQLKTISIVRAIGAFLALGVRQLVGASVGAFLGRLLAGLLGVFGGPLGAMIGYAIVTALTVSGAGLLQQGLGEIFKFTIGKLNPPREVDRGFREYNRKRLEHYEAREADLPADYNAILRAYNRRMTRAYASLYSEATRDVPKPSEEQRLRDPRATTAYDGWRAAVNLKAEDFKAAAIAWHNLDEAFHGWATEFSKRKAYETDAQAFVGRLNKTMDIGAKTEEYFASASEQFDLYVTLFDFERAKSFKDIASDPDVRLAWQNELDIFAANAKRILERAFARINFKREIADLAKGAGVDEAEAKRVALSGPEGTQLLRDAEKYIDYLQREQSKLKLLPENLPLINTFDAAIEKWRGFVKDAATDLEDRSLESVRGMITGLSSGLTEENFSLVSPAQLQRLDAAADAYSKAKTTFDRTARDSNSPFGQYIADLRILTQQLQNARQATLLAHREVLNAVRDSTGEGGKAAVLAGMFGVALPEEIVKRGKPEEIAKANRLALDKALSDNKAQMAQASIIGLSSQLAGGVSPDIAVQIREEIDRQGASFLGATTASAKYGAALSKLAEAAQKFTLDGVLSGLGEFGLEVGLRQMSMMAKMAPGFGAQLVSLGVEYAAFQNKLAEVGVAGGLKLLSEYNRFVARAMELNARMRVFTGEQVKSQLEDLGVEAVGDLTIDQFKRFFTTARELSNNKLHLKAAVDVGDDKSIAEFIERVRQGEAAARAAKRQIEALSRSFDTTLEMVNTAFGTQLSQLDLARFGSGAIAGLRHYAAQLNKVLQEALRTSAPNLTVILEQAELARVAGQMLTVAATFRKNMHESLYEGVTSGLERVNKTFGDTKLDETVWQSMDVDMRRKLGGTAALLDSFQEAMASPGLTDAQLEILTSSAPLEQRMQEFSNSVAKQLSPLELSNKLMETSNALQADANELTRQTLARAGVVTAPVVVPSAPVVGTAQPSRNQLGRAAVDSADALNNLLQGLPGLQKLGAVFRGLSLNAIVGLSAEQQNELYRLEARRSEAQRNVATASDGDDYLRRVAALNRETAALNEYITAANESADLNLGAAKRLREIGTNFGRDARNTVESAIGEALRGKRDEDKSWFETLAYAIVDKLTNSYIDAFVKAASENLLGPDPLGGFFSNWFKRPEKKDAAGELLDTSDRLFLGDKSLPEEGAGLFSRLFSSKKDGKQGEEEAETGILGFVSNIGTTLKGAFDELWSGLKGIFAGFDIGDMLSGFGDMLSKGFKWLLSFLPGFATGGYVSGPGTGTSDSIPTALSNGEFVVNAKSTRKHLPLLQAINSGRILQFAEGGLVQARPLQGLAGGLSKDSMTSHTASNQEITINITGDISRQTKAEIYKMLPQIASGVNAHNKEINYKG